MNNENNIEIKSQHRFWLIKGIFCLLLMLISLLIALLPLVSAFAKENSVIFYISGGIAFVAFTAYFVYLLYKECKPDNALILNAHGFIDRYNVGESIEIEWTNVSAVKMMGKSNMPFLGITLENTDIILDKMKKTQAAEMRENIEQNLPTILIPQSAVRMPIKDMKALFTKFVREARALENDAPKKPKHNPFSTEDVLRAFGQLPKEETVENTSEIVVEPQLSDPFEIPEDVASANDESEEKHVTASDSFYEALRAKASAKSNDVITEDSLFFKNDTNESSVHGTIVETPAENDTENSEMPDEIKDLLSKAKSSRISELEKILTDSDVPFSISNERKSPVVADEINTESSPVDEDSFEEAVLANTEDVIDDDAVSDDDEQTFEITLESMIENALDKSDAVSAEPLIFDMQSFDNAHDSNADTKEFVLDLTNAIKAKTNVDHESTDSVDDSIKPDEVADGDDE